MDSIVKAVEHAEECVREQALSDLRNALDIHLTDGNWNYDTYNYGMANGMIFALSVMTGEDPEYIHAPDEWLCDRKQSQDPSSQAIHRIMKGQVK